MLKFTKCFLLFFVSITAGIAVVSGILTLLLALPFWGMAIGSVAISSALAATLLTVGANS